MKSIAIAALLVTAQPVPTQTAPLAPTGKWTVEYADNMCVLSRSYDGADRKLTFGIRPWPMGDSVEMLLIQPNGYGVGVQNDKAKVTLGPSHAPITGVYNSYVTTKSRTRVTTVNIPHDSLTPLAEATSIDIVLSGRTHVTLDLGKTKNALTALSACTDDLLRTWHIDPLERLLAITPPEPISNIADWINNDDYPTDSINRESEGTVSIVWMIDTDGRIKNCAVAATSGDPAMDAAACTALTARGRYKPALDKDGKPIAVHRTRRVVWRLRN